MKTEIVCLHFSGSVFNPIIEEYHDLPEDFKGHVTDMDVSKIKGNIDPNAPVHSTRIRVGRNIDGIDLPPNIAYWQLMKIEDMMVDTMEVLGHKHKDLKGKYYALDGMDEEVRQQLVDDHFLFMSGDKNLIAAGMEAHWPKGRGIFHNTEKTFLMWVNEEDHLRIISMEKGTN